MSGTTNAVFRPDFTDYTTPQNRLAPQPTWADAATYNAQAVGDYIAQQRAKSEQMGLWDPNTGLPTGAGVVNAAQQYGSGLLMGTTAPGIRAFHGSPYDFERFDTSKIGTGEGNQAYGHGLYMAGAEDTARSYRENLSNPDLFVDGKKVGEIGALGTDPVANAAHALATSPSPAAAKEAVRQSMTMQQQGNFGHSQATGNAILKAIDDMAGANVEIRPGGRMYEVNIGADPEQFLHWDKPLSEQSPQVQQAFRGLGYEGGTDAAGNPMSGGNIYRSFGDPAAAATTLQQAGIPGIRYLDQGSRGLARLSDGDRQQLQAAIADKQRLIADPSQQRDVAMHHADLDLFQRRRNEADRATHNYVVFDANTIDILRKYGLAGLGIGLGTAAAGTQQQSQ